MIKVGDRVNHVTYGWGRVVGLRRSAKIALVKWDSGSCMQHYLPILKKAAR